MFVFFYLLSSVLIVGYESNILPNVGSFLSWHWIESTSCSLDKANIYVKISFKFSQLCIYSNQSNCKATKNILIGSTFVRAEEYLTCQTKYCGWTNIHKMKWVKSQVVIFNRHLSDNLGAYLQPCTVSFRFVCLRVYLPVYIRKYICTYQVITPFDFWCIVQWIKCLWGKKKSFMLQLDQCQAQI